MAFWCVGGLRISDFEYFVHNSVHNSVFTIIQNEFVWPSAGEARRKTVGEFQRSLPIPKRELRSKKFPIWKLKLCRAVTESGSSANRLVRETSEALLFGVRVQKIEN